VLLEEGKKIRKPETL